VHHHAADGGIGLHRDRSIIGTPSPHNLKADLADLRDDLAEPLPFEVVGVKGRCANKKRETPVEIHLRILIVLSAANHSPTCSLEPRTLRYSFHFTGLNNAKIGADG